MTHGRPDDLDDRLIVSCQPMPGGSIDCADSARARAIMSIWRSDVAGRLRTDCREAFAVVGEQLA
jgi:hypothetical protein